MEEELLKIIYDYSRIGKNGGKKYIEELVRIVVDARNLGKYYEDIDYPKKIKDSTGDRINAMYKPSTGKISVNLSSIKKSLNTNSCIYFQGFELNLFKNLIVAQYIFHELEHVYQEKKRNNPDNSVEVRLLEVSANIFARGTFPFEELTDIIAKYKLLYDKYYIFNPSERLAEINSYRLIVKLLDQIKNRVNALYEYEKMILLASKLYAYNYCLTCPTETFLCGIQKEEIWHGFEFYDSNRSKMFEKTKEKYCLEERLYLGLPISQSENFFLSHELRNCKF